MTVNHNQTDDASNDQEPVWLEKHVHEPNPQPPSPDTSFIVAFPDGQEHTVTVADLYRLPQSEVEECYIVSTGNGTSGPFTFRGVRLADFVTAYAPADADWSELYVISADGFGNRVGADEVADDNQVAHDNQVVHDNGARPMLLATSLDGQPLTRAQGLVRLIVPGEIDDALRQVKWIGRIEFRV